MRHLAHPESLLPEAALRLLLESGELVVDAKGQCLREVQVRVRRRHAPPDRRKQKPELRNNTTREPLPTPSEHHLKGHPFDPLLTPPLPPTRAPCATLAVALGRTRSFTQRRMEVGTRSSGLGEGGRVREQPAAVLMTKGQGWPLQIRSIIRSV
eukprot:248133-Prorocentrum_minimum.AAC.2